MHSKRVGTPAFAVLFKIHNWDSFVERQLDRLRSVVADDSIFVVFDTTNHHFFPQTTLKCLEISEDIAKQAGLFCYPPGKTFWYNNDYPMYIFSKKYPYFDYIFFCEYDCSIRFDVAGIASHMHQHSLAFVGEKVRVSDGQWHWLPSVRPHYPDSLDIDGRLLCFSGFRNDFMKILQRKRLEFSREKTVYATQMDVRGVPLWPFGEAIVGAEIALNNIRSETLSALGSTENYDWAPPYHERQLNDGLSSFAHPILDDSRYIEAISSKLNWKPRDLFAPQSDIKSWFYKIPVDIVVKIMLDNFIPQNDIESVEKLEAYAKSRNLHTAGSLFENARARIQMKLQGVRNQK